MTRARVGVARAAPTHPGQVRARGRGRVRDYEGQASLLRGGGCGTDLAVWLADAGADPAGSVASAVPDREEEQGRAHLRRGLSPPYFA